jgi:hypothetical protein
VSDGGAAHILFIPVFLALVEPLPIARVFIMLSGGICVCLFWSPMLFAFHFLGRFASAEPYALSCLLRIDHFVSYALFLWQFYRFSTQLDFFVLVSDHGPAWHMWDGVLCACLPLVMSVY